MNAKPKPPKQPRSDTSPRTNWGFRLTEAQLAEIKRRAKDRDMTATEYVLGCALGTLEAGPSVLEERMSALEKRMSRLEQFNELG